MISLPIDGVLPGVVEGLRGGSGLVLVAAPGAGKTTRVPPAIVLSGVLGREHPHVIMLQPRRVAARAAAERIAEEMGVRVGEQVGYHIRYEKRYGARTKIRVLTEGILTRMLLEEPYLEGIGCVILDEFHERNLNTDLALAFLREVQQTVRPELKIVVMSATLDAGPVAAYLGGVPVVEAAGRAYPVEVRYRAGGGRLEERVGEALNEERGAMHGDVLVFLPGVGEIERVRRVVGFHEGEVVLPLHGSLTSEEQQRALRPDEAGRRKIILATNIAETSLTIDGVRVVIDSGLVRVASFDADWGMDRLDLERVSKASATQRAGRAGRQGPGRAVRLWPESEQRQMEAFGLPEVRRVDLAGTVLAVHAWGAKEVRGFGWFEAPGEEMVAAAEELLTLLGALKEGTLTEVGKKMLGVPAHPRIARLLLAAAGTGLEGEAVTLAAVLSDDGRGGGGREERADILMQVHRPPAHLARMREQFAAVVRGMRREGGGSAARSLEELLLLAYPDRVARRRGRDPLAGVMVGGIGVRLEALTPAIAAAPLFLALDARHDPRNRKAEALVRTAVPVEEEMVARLFPAAMRVETALEFDAEKGKVVGLGRRWFGDLLLEEDPHGKVDPARAGEALARALVPRAREIFMGDAGAARFLARMALVVHYAGDMGWPAMDDAALGRVLEEACRGKKSVAEVTGGLAEALRGVLVYPLDRQLEQMAPEAMEVPSGSKIKLEYGMPGEAGGVPPAPVLAVRLQEVFGWEETPRVCGGRVAVLMHLLSPGYKPVQITGDLRSFWRSAYFEVRKDLRVRYPKHKWPDDPLTAVAEAKGRPRK